MNRYGGPLPASAIAGALRSKNGTPVLSTDQDALTGGFGPSLRRMITSGVYNGDFNDVPAAGNQVTDENPLPFWTIAQASGTAFEAYSLADGATASGRSIRLVLTAGAASDEGYLEQLIPVNGSQGQSYGYLPVATIKTAGSVNGIEAFIRHHFLKEDGTTTTGSATTKAATTTSIGATTLLDLKPDNAVVVPADAYWLRIQVGLRRAAAATSDTVTVTLHEVRAVTGGTKAIAVDSTDPATYGYAAIDQLSGIARIRANEAGAAPNTAEIDVDGVNNRIEIGASTTTFIGGVAFDLDNQNIVAAGDTIKQPGLVSGIYQGTVLYLVNNTGGSITLTSAPTLPSPDLSAGVATLAVLVGAGTQNVVVQDQGTLAGSNLRLAAASRTLGPRDVLTLLFIPGVGDWVEVSFSNNL